MNANPLAIKTGCLSLLLVLMITWSACQWNRKPDVIKGDENIRYFHDSRTDLCFAAMNSQTGEFYSITSIANVPCTEKVQAIIQGK